MTADNHAMSVAVLCSGFGLGFYIPGLLIEEKLNRLGVSAHVEVFENLLTEQKRDSAERARLAYQSDFRIALASQRVPNDIRQALDENAVTRLLKKWEENRLTYFICLSGHWIVVLDRYRERVGSVHANLLYLDADLTPSWKQLKRIIPGYAEPYEDVTLYDEARRAMLLSVDANMGDPVPYPDRDGRLVVHGGGWGIGTFSQAVDQLESAGFMLDLVCYGEASAVSKSPTRRYYMDDPGWRTWHRDITGRHTFPPFGEVFADGERARFAPQVGCHGLHRVIRRSQAIVSKPGSGTLIDSFASATPLIMLEPFGDHEKKNADLWNALGFGIQYDAWAASGYSRALLERLHANLLAKRGHVPDYAEWYAKTLHTPMVRRSTL